VLLPVAFASSLLGVGADLRRALSHRRLALVVGGAAVMLGSAAIHHFLPHGSTLRLTTDGVLVISILVILLAMPPSLDYSKICCLSWRLFKGRRLGHQKLRFERGDQRGHAHVVPASEDLSIPF
jgi:hypothetical protein